MPGLGDLPDRAVNGGDVFSADIGDVGNPVQPLGILAVGKFLAKCIDGAVTRQQVGGVVLGGGLDDIRHRSVLLVFELSGSITLALSRLAPTLP